VNRFVAGAGSSGPCSRWDVTSNQRFKGRSSTPILLKHGAIIACGQPHPALFRQPDRLFPHARMLALWVNRSRTGSRRCRQGRVRLFPFLWPDPALFRQDVGAAGYRRSEARRRQRNESFPIRQKCFKALSANSSLSVGARMSAHAISVKSRGTAHSIPTPEPSHYP
jgi:hypothetical protein